MKTPLFLIIATVLWGLNFHFGKTMLQESTPMIAGFWRYLFAAIALLFFTLKTLPSWSLVKSNFVSIFVVGVIGLFGFNFFYFLGLKYTSAVNASLIMGINPMLTLVFSVLILKTKITTLQITGLFVAFVGVVLLVCKWNVEIFYTMQFSKGDFYIIIGNVVFALQHVFVKKYHGRLSTMHFTMLTNLVCFLGFAVFFPFQDFGKIVDYSATFWFSTIAIGVFGTALAYYLWNKGVGEIGAHNAAIYMNIAPLAAVLFASLFGEQLFQYHIYSFIIITVGVLIMQTKSRKQILKS